MKPDSMLVEPVHIINARQDVAAKGTAKAISEICGMEPVLAGFVHDSLATISGKLSLPGAPTELVQGSHEDMLALVLTCVQAIRCPRACDGWIEQGLATVVKIPDSPPFSSLRGGVRGKSNPQACLSHG
jgi:hypothetical protein